MKTTKFLITSLLAAAVMGTNAFGVELSGTADGTNQVNGVSADTNKIYSVSGTNNGANSVGTLSIEGDYTVKISTAGWMNFDIDSANLTGTGTLEVVRTNATTWSTVTTLTNASAFEGTIKIVSGGTTNHMVNLSGSAANATLNLANGDIAARVTAENISLGGLVGVAGAKIISKASMPAASSSEGNQVYGNANDATVRTLTLSGSGDYVFEGTIGSTENQTSLNLTKSGTGTQTFSGTTYLGNLDVSGGNFVLSGTANIAGTTTVTGGTLDVSSGTTTFGGALTLSGGSVAIGTLGDETNAAVAVAGAVTISNSVGVTFSGTVKNGTYAIFSGSSVSLAENALTLSATNSGFEQTWTTNGNVTYVTISGAANNALVWTGGTDSWTWNTSDEKWKLFGTDTAYAFATGDDVRFATAGAQIVFGDTAISAGAITIAADTTFSGTAGKLSATGGITILGGASLMVQSKVWNQGKITGGIKLDGADAKLILVGNTALLGNAVSGTGTLVFNQTDTSSSLVINVANLLQGGISVEKTGEGTLQLGSSYSYTGGTTVKAGTLSLTAAGAIGTGTLTLDGGTVFTDYTTPTFANDVVVKSGSQFNTHTRTVTLSGNISGTGTLTKAGTGTLKLTNANVLNGTSAFGGKILVSAGTLQFGDTTASMTISVSGGIEVASGATLYFSGTNSGYHKVTSDIVLNAGSTIQVRDAGGVTSENAQYTFAGTVTVNPSESGVAKITTDSNNWAKEIEISGNLVGAGTLNYYRGNGDGNFNSNGRLIISGADNSQFTGKILVGGGANTLSNGLDLKANLSNATVALQASTASGANPVFMRVMKDAEVKRLEGNAGTSIGVGVANGAYTLTVGEGDFAGTIADNSYNTMAQGAGSATNSALLVTGGVLSIVKNTAGTLTLSGNNTFTGGVTIEQGVLVAGHANALGTTAGTTTVNSGGVLKVAVDGGVTAGTVTLNEGALLAIDLTEYSNVEEGTALTIISSSAISFNSISAGDMSSNDIETYFSASNSNLGKWTDYLRTWSYDAGSGLRLTLTIPEPSTFGLLAGLGALALAGTRRRRRKA